MKVWEIQNNFGMENLCLSERDEPQPQAGEVKIKVHAASLNYRDIMMIAGSYNPRQSLPLIPFSDGAGEIVALGEGVSGLQVSQKVVGSFCQNWLAGSAPGKLHSSTLGGPIDGMLAEYVCLPACGVVPVPDHLNMAQAATLPCAGVTAWHALMEERPIRPGQDVLLLGTGGVSIFALQFARMAGARIIITSSSAQKIEKALALGAHDAINYQTEPEWHRQVVKLTSGKGADHVVEVGGSGTLERSLKSVRIGGVVSIIGVLSGGGGNMNLLPVLTRAISLQGIFVGSRAMLEHMNQAITLHQMTPIVDRVFEFDQVHEALTFMQQGLHFGKVVIRVV